MIRKNKIDTPPCTECKNKNSIFCILSDEEKENLSVSKGSNFYQKGQVVFYEGNYPHGLFCIHKGKVKISKLGDEGKEQVVRLAGTGEILGYRAVLSGESYKATATVLEDSYICHLSKDSFNKILEENNVFSLSIIKLLSQDLKNSESQLLNISQKPARERLAETLLILKEKFGLDEDNQLDLVLTRRELGDIAGVTVETAIRTISDFNKENVIAIKGKKIQFKNIPKLIKIANIID
ncbi:MAG: Crp/Fnr family transcriptional regulator [Vicingaceae bacterium]